MHNVKTNFVQYHVELNRKRTVDVEPDESDYNYVHQENQTPILNKLIEWFLSFLERDDNSLNIHANNVLYLKIIDNNERINNLMLDRKNLMENYDVTFNEKIKVIDDEILNIIFSNKLTIFLNEERGVPNMPALKSRFNNNLIMHVLPNMKQKS